MIFFSARCQYSTCIYSTPRPGVGANVKGGLVLRGANPQEIKLPLLPHTPGGIARYTVIAARVLKYRPFRAARTGGALGAYCDRGIKREYLEN
jgi:hypothetical protein